MSAAAISVTAETGIVQLAPQLAEYVAVALEHGSAEILVRHALARSRKNPPARSRAQASSGPGGEVAQMLLNKEKLKLRCVPCPCLLGAARGAPH